MHRADTGHAAAYATQPAYVFVHNINDKYFDRIWFLMRFCAHSPRHFALLLFILGNFISVALRFTQFVNANKKKRKQITENKS